MKFSILALLTLGSGAIAAPIMAASDAPFSRGSVDDIRFAPADDTEVFADPGKPPGPGGRRSLGDDVLADPGKPPGPGGRRSIGDDVLADPGKPPGPGGRRSLGDDVLADPGKPPGPGGKRTIDQFIEDVLAADKRSVFDMVDPLRKRQDDGTDAVAEVAAC